LANEYQLEVMFEPSPFAEARWLAGPARTPRSRTSSTSIESAMATDIDDQPVFLAKSAWELGYVAERYPDLGFQRTRERG
jgi:peptide chain release factor 3